MPHFNQFTIMGHLTREPQLKFLPSGSAIAEFGVACNSTWTTKDGEKREEVLFIDAAAFGKLGEVINQYFTKGKPIFLQGRLSFSQWEDKNGGGKRSKISMVVDTFQFIGAPGGGGEPGDDQTAEQRRPASRPPARRPAPAAAPQESPISEEEQFEEADIPF